MKLMYDFKITYLNKQNKEESFTQQASNEWDLRKSLAVAGYRIKNVTNLTMESYAYQVANILVSSGKNHPDQRVRDIALFSRPIASEASHLISQYKHILEGDKLDNAKSSALTIWNHIFNNI